MRRIAVIAAFCGVLGACGISPDHRPRDIDPDKQEILLPSTSTTTTTVVNP
ncbi:MAG: hypothetical protein WC864_00365 [Ilumatobacteraceae bacterium]